MELLTPPAIYSIFKPNHDSCFELPHPLPLSRRGGRALTQFLDRLAPTTGCSRLAPWASRRRQDLLELLDHLNPIIAKLTEAVEQEAEKCAEAQRLMTHPGVGPLTALAFVLVIGTAGERRRLGHISKQGNSLLRFLLVEAAQVTVRSNQQWRSKFFHLAMRRGRKIAKVAMARRLAIRLYWMWRKRWNYEQLTKFGAQGRKLSFHTVLTKGSTR